MAEFTLRNVKCPCVVATCRGWFSDVRGGISHLYAHRMVPNTWDSTQINFYRNDPASNDASYIPGR